MKQYFFVQNIDIHRFNQKMLKTSGLGDIAEFYIWHLWRTPSLVD